MLNSSILGMCFSIKDELIKKVSGRVNFRTIDVLDNSDSYVIFKIEFKEFVYEHAVNIETAMMTMSANEIANCIVNDYKTTVNKTFFKK